MRIRSAVMLINTIVRTSGWGGCFRRVVSMEVSHALDAWGLVSFDWVVVPAHTDVDLVAAGTK
jgi:hypothetical protein